MRLLFYVNRFKMVGAGLENQAVRLCCALAARGHDVHVLTDEADEFRGITIHRDLSTSVALCGQILPELCIDWGFIYPADIHRMGQGTHEGYMNYSLDSYSGPARIWKRIRYASNKHQRIIARQRTLLGNPTAHFLANSQQTADMAIAGGADPEKVSVYHQSVDLSVFRPDLLEHRESIREMWKVDAGHVVFLFVAHNLHLKNLALLKKVFQKMPEELSAKLVVAGKRSPGFSAPWLIYGGQTPYVERFYAAADVLVHPTWFDSCANVVIEAMACGKPVVVSDSAGINEIVRHGQDGSVISVRGRDVQSNWLQALTALAKDPDLRKRQGISARETAEARSYKRFIDWFEDYIQRVRKEKMEREGLTE